MNFQKKAFVRKVTYASVIMVLFFPLFILGMPATRASKASLSNKGGWLARMRDEHNLSQTSLGDIDIGGESMKLATLGLRGFAGFMLWQRAEYYKKTEQFDRLRATLNQIAKVQPNYVAVWDFQAHNLTFNVSVEFDDFRHRYIWVKKGIDYLIEGMQYNRRQAKMITTIGRYFGIKFGRSDEKFQYRRLFRDDADFHKKMDEHLGNQIANAEAAGPGGKPDSWLVSRLWHLKAQAVLDSSQRSVTATNPLLFFSNAPKARMFFAAAIEDEGYHGEMAQQAWRTALREWQAYGQRSLPSSFGHTLRLGSLDALNREIAQLRKELDALAPNVRETLKKERMQQLPQEARDALNTPEENRSEDQMRMVSFAGMQMQVGDEQVAEAAPEANRPAARLKVANILKAGQMMGRVLGYRSTVNYDYWETRCKVEQEDMTILARRYTYQAEKMLDEARLEEAKKSFELAWEQWAKVFEQYPVMMKNVTAEEVMDSVRRYTIVLRQLDEELPRDFKLKKLLEVQRSHSANIAGGSRVTTEGKKKGDAKKKDSKDKGKKKAAEKKKAAGKKAAGKKAAGKKAAEKKAAEKKGPAKKK